jgi:DNA helicase II / ATP-dependent DNA helicase PcrA
MANDFLNDLNDVQQQAVRQTGGPALIIAGAGSGKTRVLTYRIAWLLEQGIPARSILALTFTNKAATEMKERIACLVGFESAKHLWMGTFHSVFARILRFEAAHTGYTSNFTIYDTADSRNVIRQIVKELMLDEQLYKPGEIFARISSAKNNLVSAGAYASNQGILEEDSKSRRPRLADIYRLYQKRCHLADAMDFDDLLLNTNILFRDHPEVLSKYQDAFRYILVDEYQDTNYAQYLIVSRLAARHRNLSVVGDDAQSIYAFRGARIENILNFRKDYPDHKIFKLEQNYRSTKVIVNAANSLIAKNRGQISKTVWSAREAGEKITVIECPTDLEEGAEIARSITGRKEKSRCDYSGIAILYRTNAQSRIFEEALRRHNIPYRVYGSLSFYQRKEIKDLLAYFRLAINNRDREAFYRIINYPARGIGKTTVEKIASLSNETGLHPWEIINNTGKYRTELNINTGAASKLAGFADLIKDFSLRVPGGDAWQTAMHIASSSGILKDLFDPRSTENIAKYENIQELLNAVKEFSLRQTEMGEDASLGTFLHNVSLLSDTDTEKPDERDKVSLMTIHAAKGLEFDHVYVGGLEEELFPNRFAVASPSELEEERRLFYVAITRAASSLTLSHAATRYRWGVPAMCRPSRFLSEIDPQFLDYPVMEDIPGVRRQKRPVILDSPVHRRHEGPNESQRYPATPRKPEPAPPPPQGRPAGTRLLRMEKAARAPESQGDDLSGLRAGMNVHHERFGKGVVEIIEGDPPNTRATVDFASAGRKQLLLKFAKLKILPS